MSLALALLMFSGTFDSFRMQITPAQSLWLPYPLTGQSRLLTDTLKDTSFRNTGIPNALDILVLGSSPSLRWALRDWPNVTYADVIPEGENPSVLITGPNEKSPSLESTYRGQDFSWEVYPAWSGVLPPNLPRWLAFHLAPTQESKIILWVKADLFPGVSSASPVGIAPQPDTQPQVGVPFK
jgi:hypothetical protein